MHPVFIRYDKPSMAFRLLAILLISLSFWTYGEAQDINLVLNPSFEKRVYFEQASPISNWSKCLKDDTPDYIEFSKRGEPEFYYRKYIGGLLPYDGEAYAGIFCLRTNKLMGVEDVREFIQVPLKEPLKKDTIYRVSLAIALDPESTIAIHNFNMHFSHEAVNLKREKQIFDLNPQIRFQDSFLESITWIELASSYKAKGYESHLILGNFLPDNRSRKKRVAFESKMLKKWDLHELEDAAYYYIDKVTIMKDSDWQDILTEENPIDSLQVSENAPATDNPIEPDPGRDTVYVNIFEVKADSSIILSNIFFDFDKSDLLPESFNELDRLNNQLNEYSDLSIIIEGHTDNMGTFEYNMDLSLRRARAVVEYLRTQGLPEERIKYEGYGYTRPLTDNRDESGRQLNRRVAFRINNDK